MDPVIKKTLPISSDAYLRDQMEKLTKDSKSLKSKVELLEKENIALKKSLYELSTRYNTIAHKLQPFTLEGLEAQDAGIEGLLAGGHESDPFVSGNNRDKHKDGRYFSIKHELKGHTGAVYSVQFSPCGRFVSSGSFDKTVRVWDAMASQKELHCFRKHTLNVSDLCWSNDSTELLSGAYDQTCKLWDIEGGKLVQSYETEGFVQCVMYNPTDNNIFFSGTSRKILGMLDRRKPENSLIMENDGMINSLYVYRDGLYVITADSLGSLKTWDVRTGKCLQSFLVEPTKKPISHITVCYNNIGDDEPRYLAANSYDNGKSIEHLCL